MFAVMPMRELVCEASQDQSVGKIPALVKPLLSFGNKKQSRSGAAKLQFLFPGMNREKRVERETKTRFGDDADDALSDNECHALERDILFTHKLPKQYSLPCQESYLSNSQRPGASRKTRTSSQSQKRSEPCNRTKLLYATGSKLDYTLHVTLLLLSLLRKIPKIPSLSCGLHGVKRQGLGATMQSYRRMIYKERLCSLLLCSLRDPVANSKCDYPIVLLLNCPQHQAIAGFGRSIASSLDHARHHSRVKANSNLRRAPKSIDLKSARHFNHKAGMPFYMEMPDPANRLPGTQI